MKTRIVSIVTLILLAVFFEGCDYFNEPPVIEEVTASKTEVGLGKEVTINVVANDPDGDKLTYEYKVSGGEMKGSGGIVTWVAPEKEGTYFINVTVRDGSNWVQKSINITVTPLGDGKKCELWRCPDCGKVWFCTDSKCPKCGKQGGKKCIQQVQCDPPTFDSTTHNGIRVDPGGIVVSGTNQTWRIHGSVTHPGCTCRIKAIDEANSGAFCEDCGTALPPPTLTLGPVADGFVASGNYTGHKSHMLVVYITFICCCDTKATFYWRFPGD